MAARPKSCGAPGSQNTAEGSVTAAPSNAISRAPVASASATVEFEVPKSMPQNCAPMMPSKAKAARLAL